MAGPLHTSNRAGVLKRQQIEDWETHFTNALTEGAEDEMIVPTGTTWFVTEDTTVPANITLRVERGGEVWVNSGKTLTLNCFLDAPPTSIFNGPGTVTGATLNKRLLVQWFGVKGDGSTDDTAALQKALTFASNNDRTVYIPAGTTVRTTSNLFLHGGGSVEGENMTDSIIQLDADLGATTAWHVRYWIVCGIPNIPAAQVSAPVTADSWNGHMRNLKLVGTANAVVTDCVCFLTADNFSVNRVELDITAMGSVATGGFNANVDGNWTTAPHCDDGVISECVHRSQANKTQPYTGGMNLTGCESVVVRDCFIYGPGDDSVMFINSDKCKIINCHAEGPLTRFGFFSCRECVAIGNTVVRTQALDGWAGGSDFYTCQIASASQPTSKGCAFIGNTAILPDGPTGVHTAFAISGTHDTIVANNIFRNDCTTSSNEYMVRTGTELFPAWTDPDGDEPDATSRPRNQKITGNVAKGTQTTTRLEMGAVLGTDIIGPIYIAGNHCGTYNTFGDGSIFGPGNTSFNTDASAFDDVLGESVECVDTHTFKVREIRGGFTAVGEPGTGATDGRLYFKKPGWIAYAEINTDLALTGAAATLQIKKNGSGILTTVNVAASGRHALLDGRTYEDRVLAADDYITVEVAGAADLSGVYDAIVTVYTVRTRG